MARQPINIGTAPNDGTGDTLRDAFDKINDNETELYARILNASSASSPTVNDDSGDGYSAGSIWFNTTIEMYFVCQDASVGAAVWTRLQAAMQPHMAAGRWYPCNGGPGTGAASSTISANTVRFVPFMVPHKITINEIGAQISTADAAGTFQLAIFGAESGDTPYRPSGLPLAYTVNTLSTAAVAVVTAALNVNLTLLPGVLYFAATLSNSATVAFSAWASSNLTTAFWIGGATIGAYANSTTNTNIYMSIAHTLAADMNTLNVAPGSVAFNGASVVRNALVHMKVLSVP